MLGKFSNLEINVEMGNVYTGKLRRGYNILASLFSLFSFKVVGTRRRVHKRVKAFDQQITIMDGKEGH